MMCLRKILGVTEIDKIRNTLGVKYTIIYQKDELNQEPKLGIEITHPWTTT